MKSYEHFDCICETCKREQDEVALVSWVIKLISYGLLLAIAGLVGLIHLAWEIVKMF